MNPLQYIANILKTLPLYKPDFENCSQLILFITNFFKTSNEDFRMAENGKCTNLDLVYVSHMFV